MPYKGEQKVIFPQEETSNVMLLFGDNMRGKTSFLNAIRWGFYGKSVARHLKPIPTSDLVNIDAAKEDDWNMYVGLKFSNLGKRYELRREVKKKAHVSQPKRDTDFEQKLGLRINGEAIPYDEIDREINQISPEEISRFFLFDGELLQEYENLLIEDSEQGEKIKEHIEQALGVPALIHGRDEISSLLKDARKLQTKDAKKDDELKAFAEKQIELQESLTSIENDLDRLNDQKEEIDNKIDYIDDELKNTEAVQNKKIKLEKLDVYKKSIKLQIKALANERRVLLKTAYLDVLHNNMSQQLDESKEARDELENISVQKTILNTHIITLAKSIDDHVCATCKQIVPDEKVQSMHDEMANLRVKVENLAPTNLDQIIKLNYNIDIITKIKSANEINRLIKNSREVNTLKVTLLRIESEEDEIQNEIKRFDTDQIMRQRIKRDQYIALQTNLKSDIDQKEAEKRKNINLQNHIANIIAKSEGGKDKRSSIRVNIYQDLEAIFTKGVDQLRDALRTDVEFHASKAFTQLTTEKTYSGLKINDNYGLSILYQEGLVQKQRSAGAEQIVALSLIDGLNRTARKAGPIVMDTPLGRLDPKHRGNVLKYLPKMAEQVILLVHEGEIDPKQDLQHFSERIGVRYVIERISATKSQIVKWRQYDRT